MQSLEHSGIVRRDRRSEQKVFYMNGEVKLRITAGTKVQDFLEAHPFGNEQGNQVAAKFVERMNRARVLFTQQEAGDKASADSAKHRKGLRLRITSIPVRHLCKISQSVAAEHPEVTAGHRVTELGRGQVQFVAGVEVILQEAEAHRDLYVQHGMLEESLEELKRMLEAYRQSIADSNAALRSHTGARNELQSLSRELVKMMAVLDGVMVYRLRNQPELQGAWASARNIAWPAGESRTPAKEKGA